MEGGGVMEEAREYRDEKGRFLPGLAPNPRGRPKKDPEAVAILKAAVPDAARKLVALMGAKESKIALQAAMAVLDRVWGKPVQASEVTVEAGPDIRAEVRAALLERAAGHGERRDPDDRGG